MATSSSWKKSNIPDSSSDTPVITYRHLHSNSLGPRDPLRAIALCDSDAFYAACEQVRLGTDPNTPLVVLQWESIIAVNYPARKFGISRMEKIGDARKRCPELVVVHVATYKEGESEPGYWDNIDSRTHKVSLDLYRRESIKIIEIFKERLPTGEVEKASIDEAFIDFSRPVREKLLERYPHLADVPPDGMDRPLPGPPPPISWDGLGVLVPLEDDDQEDQETTWHDVALSIAAELMDEIRKEVHEKLGYTMSAGISRNKFLAKLTASHKKPNNQSILRNAAIPSYLHPMPFQKIRFLGGKLGDAIAKEYDVSTVGDLLSVSLEEMQRKFGESAIWVYDALRGIDLSEVKEKSALNKSMLASKNLPRPITRAAEGHHWIRVLAAELALRLADARRASPTIWPRAIVLHARQGYEAGHSKQAPFPFVRDANVDVIVAAGDKLWRELVPAGGTVKVTSVQLAFTGLEAAGAGQRSIEGFLKRGRVEEGEEASGVDPSTSTGAGPSTSRRVERERSNAPRLSFTCEKCGKQIAVPAEDHSYDDANGAESEARVTAAQMEHADFHMAQDLEREWGRTEKPAIAINVRSSSGTSSAPPLSKKRRKSNEKKEKGKTKDEGIARFFSKK